MIVGLVHDGNAQRTTLDDLFRRAAVRAPDDIALADPPDRVHVTDGEARGLTYAQADRIIWTMAARLRALGLQADAVVGLQLPNTVESVLALLGVLRAGLIAAPLPMLWRENEIVAALSSVGAKAFLTASRIGTTDHAALAGRIAAKLFSIRHVCAFGGNLADGIVPLDDVFEAAADINPAPPRDGNPAAHAAVVTFEPTPRGIQPVTRNHMHLIAAGSAVMDEAALQQNCSVLSATPLSSFAGLSVTLLPWLLCGGRLALHQPFNPEHFEAQKRVHECDVIVVPGPLAGGFWGSDGTTTLALWRAPERMERETPHGNIIDVTVYGEHGLHAARRGASPARPPVDFRCPHGTLAMKGPMVAPTGFAPSNATAAFLDHVDGVIDTGYPCRIDPATGLPLVTGPQPGMIGIGGYRIARSEIDAFGAALPPDCQIATLPDALLGQRLRGRAGDPDAAADMLAAQGANALIGSAFARR